MLCLIEDDEAYALEDASQRAQVFLYKAAFRFMGAEEDQEGKAKMLVAIELAALTVAALMAELTEMTKTDFLNLAGEIFDEVGDAPEHDLDR